MCSPVSLFVLPLLALGLAGCPPPPVPEYPPISFADQPPLALDVASIRIEVPHVESLDPPHVGHEFPVPPLTAARRWAEERLRAVGNSGVAVVTIREAGATETELERSKGLKGLIKQEESQRYEVIVSVKITAVSGDNTRRANAEAVARRSITVLENADFNEREETWYQLTKDTMADFDAVMTKEIGRSLRAFVR